MKNPSIILAPISIGELFDKLTILEIKRKKIEGNQLNNIKKEIIQLEEVIKNNNLEIDNKIFSDLQKINFGLWEIEDKIRIKDSKNEFDQEFIDLAKSVYKENDKRATLKKEINLKYDSFLIEKNYTKVLYSFSRFIFRNLYIKLIKRITLYSHSKY